MDSKRWHRIEALFDQATELPEAERRRFLAEACRGDAELERELTALLASAASAGASLRAAVVAEARILARDAASAQIGRRIGAFRLTALLGEGGMGAVYLGERADEQFSQRVAIKILPHALGSPALIARFRDERQILAALDHPNIVRLLDGGSTDDALPYLVMEHIEGTTITQYAEQRQLAIRARVALVRQVCAALQYAHQNLVVHRDIKPSNILVDAHRAPKILDFGIAKLLAPIASFEREAVTHTGVAMGTLGYAAPEQARGDAVSTATDVYSVGAVLYELVTGQLPHVTTGSGLELLRVNCEVDPPRPSAVARTGWRRELAGDLDTIILKALHKEPARRYSSMEQLSGDLGRWHDGLPVIARTGTLRYRTRKFARRVVATTLVAAALLAATVVSLRQAGRADDQAARAQVEQANAEAARKSAELERANAVDAAKRAQTEADRARRAEAQLQAQLDKIKDQHTARAWAEAVARVQGSEAQLSRRQRQGALARAMRDKAIVGTTKDLTSLLRAWRNGDRAALDEVAPLIFDELRRLAALHLRGERPGRRFSPTDVISEAYLRLASGPLEFEDRAHFFAIASRCMRQIFVDEARKRHADERHADKRGGGVRPAEVDERRISMRPVELVAFDEWLQELAKFDERKALISELGYFGGLTHSQIAAVCGVHVNTVARDLQLSTAWLRNMLAEARKTGR